MHPSEEQKVIADKLDILLAKVENTNAGLEHIPHILKRFRQSVLAAGVSEWFTADWRTSNSQQSAGLLLDEIAQVMTTNLKAEIAAGNRESSKVLKKINRPDPSLPETGLPEP